MRLQESTRLASFSGGAITYHCKDETAMRTYSWVGIIALSKEGGDVDFRAECPLIEKVEE